MSKAQLRIGILQIVDTLLQDVAQDPSRLRRAHELAEDQIRPLIEAEFGAANIALCPATFHPEGYECSRMEGHSGDHVAQGWRGGVIKRWPQ